MMSLRDKNLQLIGMDDEKIRAEINLCKQKTAEHQREIAQIFMKMGYADKEDDVKITIGPELECTEIAGFASYLKRSKQINNESVAAMKNGDNPRFNINDKKGAYMPSSAQVPYLDKIFEDKARKLGPHVNRARVEAEPAFSLNMFDDASLPGSLANRELVPELVAASQIEFTAPPLSSVGAAEWLNKTMNHVAHGATNIGLKRIDFKAVPHQATAPNSIHLNSVITVKGKNAFSKAEWEDNPAFKGQASDILVCVGKAHIDYLKHSLFLFARAENDYERYERKEVSGPSYYGIPTRKQHGNFGTAMFRGEGRKTERLNSAYPEKEDQGPLRFELRVPGPGAAGHPNKTAYPEQQILPYQMIEAYTHMLLQGVKLWQQRIEQHNHGHDIPALSEPLLDPNILRNYEPLSAHLPDTKAVALAQFLNSEEAQQYWGDRISSTLLPLSERTDQINAADEHPFAREKGPHIERMLTKLPSQTR